MFTIKFFYFLKGYVIIRASGKSVYELINRCNRHGIRLYNAEGGNSVTFTVSRKDFFELARISRETHTKIKIIKKYGLVYTLHRYRKRKAFAVGAIIFVLFFAISSQFLWDIKIEGEDDINREAVLECLAEIGVKPGMPLAMLPDGVTMKEKLINKFDNITWAWVYIDGVRAKVSIRKGTVPPIMVDEDKPCNIVASRDGFIIDMSVKKGMEVINTGNAVNAGEVIISGKVDTGSEDNPKSFFVHADGTVHALTHYERTKEYPLNRPHPEFTGKRKSTYRITLFSHSFNIGKTPNFEYYIKHDDVFAPEFTEKHFNFSICRSIYEEALRITEPLPAEWVKEEAKRDLSAIIANELSAGAQLQSQEYLVTENTESITVTAKMDFIESIGTAIPIE